MSQRPPTPPSSGGKGGGSGSGGGGSGGSRGNTPVLARYAVLQQRQVVVGANKEASAAAGGATAAAAAIAVPVLPTLVHATSSPASGGAGMSVTPMNMSPRMAVVVPASLARAASSNTSTANAATVTVGGAAAPALSAATAAALGVGSSCGGGGGGPEEPRSSTPARLSRVLSPLKGRATRGYVLGGSSLAGGGGEQALSQAQQQQAAAAAEAAAAVRRRVERHSRRKLRRWANDRLVAVAQYAPGGAHLLDADTGDFVAGGHTVGGAFACFDATADRHPTRFTALMAAEHQEVRDRFLQGYYGAGGDSGAGGPPRRHGGRRHRHGEGGGAGTRTAVQEAEARFLRLERRLRGILTQIVATNPDMEAFLAAVEALLRAFAQGEPLPAPATDGTDDDSAASSDAPLARALVGPIRIDSSASTSSKRPTTTLVLPLRGSAFLRLLVHGCAQYYGLKSRSEDLLAAPNEPPCRAVLVTRPSPSSAALLGGGAAGGGGNLGMTMRAFIRHSRLEQGRLKPGCKGRRLGGGEQEGGEAAEGGEP